ncbi:MAG TPA: sigma-70 family RNA polymerase sigma factor [Acidimicrobiales bacterium]
MPTDDGRPPTGTPMGSGAPGIASDADVDALWTAHRRRLLDIAFRMLLDVGEAEDVVQEAFVRLSRTDVAALDDPEGWLVVVTSRLAIDRLRARRRHPTGGLDRHLDRREDDTGDPFDAGAVDPADQVTLADDVTLALHAVLERLTPAERTSFVLHDVFRYPFDQVAAIVGRTPAACRQLARRARQALRAESAAGRFPVDVELHRRVSERFVEAAAGGDLDALIAVLDPAVEGASDLRPDVVTGPREVAAGILRYLGPPDAPTLLHLPVGDRAGIVALRGRRVVALVLLTIEDGLVAHVHALAGPAPRAAVGAALGLR